MSDREESPDWLREFQTPTRNVVTLSSASETSPEVSPRRNDDTYSSHDEAKMHHEEKKTILLDSGEDSPAVKTKKPKATKARKSVKGEGEDGPVVKTKETKAKKNQKNLKVEGEDSPRVKTKKTKTAEALKNHEEEDPLDAFEEEAYEEDTKGKSAGPSVASRLPLLFPEKVHRTKALVECDGDSIDLSGDVGAVGRLVVSNGPAGNPEMLLDLKGTIYKSAIVPSRTFCIVSVGQTEAKVEAIMNDFIKLEPQSNVFEAETMIEGTLEGFSFDSDEEGEKMPKLPNDQSNTNNENADQSNSKKKRGRAGRAGQSSGSVKKKAKAAARPPKTVKKAKKPKK